ncbi:MAG: sigma-70 family RNA polymerase sigma factor [Myxococcota bacterium]
MPQPGPVADAEEAIQQCCKRNAYEEAATLILETYGDQIFGFLVSRLRNRPDAEEVFSIFSEDLWKGLPGFGWRCSVLAWSYILARNAERRFHRGGRRAIALSDAPSVLAVAERVRTSTLPFIKTEIKDKFRALRDRLTEEEQLLLILRVDKGLRWQDVASVLNEEAGADARDVARARKRFQLVKEKLRQLGEAEGLLPSSQ